MRVPQRYVPHGSLIIRRLLDPFPDSSMNLKLLVFDIAVIEPTRLLA